MLSLRLKTIVKLVDKEASVVDIGTDHAYIPIYLVQNNITNDCLATDISPKVLEYAKKNIKDNHLEDIISLKVSDGFKNIDRLYDIAIIAGMGASSIIDILKGDNIPNTLIIESNNNLGKLRRFINDLGYKIEKEIVIYDKKYYSIIKYIKKREILSEEEILFGKSNNLDYYRYLLNKYQKIYDMSGKEEHQKYIAMLESIIEKIPE